MLRFVSQTERDYRHQHQNIRIRERNHYETAAVRGFQIYVANVARVNAASLAMLARRRRGQNVTMTTPFNDTDLKWEANKNRLAAMSCLARQRRPRPVRTRDRSETS